MKTILRHPEVHSIVGLVVSTLVDLVNHSEAPDPKRKKVEEAPVRGPAAKEEVFNDTW